MGIDPVAPNPENIHSFNRYAYANNNPYKFVDPDGRLPILIPLAAFVAKEAAAEVASYYTGGWSDYLSVRRVGTKVVTAGTELVETKLSAAVREGIKDWPVHDVAKGANKAPNFIVAPGGTAFPVPKGASGPTPVFNQAGKQTGDAFTDGAGGANGQVTTMRIMDPTPSRGASPGYPNGYIKYENSALPKPQGVDPYTGKTLPNSQSHFPID